MKEKNDPFRPLRRDLHNLRITYELFNRLRERMLLGTLCVGIGRGAEDVLDLREGDDGSIISFLPTRRAAFGNGPSSSYPHLFTLHPED